MSLVSEQNFWAVLLNEPGKSSLVPHVVCKDTGRPIQLLRKERTKEEGLILLSSFSSGFLSPSFLRSSPACGYDQCLCSIMFPDSPEASVWRRDWPVSCSVSGPRWTAVLLMKCRGPALLITTTREAQAAKCTEHVRAVSPQVLWELKSISSVCHRTIKE